MDTNYDFEQILRPPRFDAETLNTKVLKEWEHWRKCFENFISSIEEIVEESRLPSNYDLKYLINHLSPRVYDHVKDITTYDEMISQLDEQIRFNPPEATVAATVTTNKTKSVDPPQEYNLNDLTKLTEKLFDEAKLGKLDTINEIKEMKEDKLKTIIEAHNRRHKTLLQEAIANGHEEFAGALLNTIGRVNVDEPSKHELCKSELIAAAETFIYNSIPKLVDFRIYPQSKSAAAISTILYAHNFITEYKKYLSGKIIDADVVIVDALLEALEFDERCAKFSTLDQGRGLLYYELTKSVKESDVIFFIDLFEYNAIAPVKRFLRSLKKL